MRAATVALGLVLVVSPNVMAETEPNVTYNTPYPWITFCLNNPAECVPENSKPKSLTLGPVNLAIMQAVNSKLNNEIVPADDLQLYGKPDWWTYPTEGFGDCEDYALGKQKALRDAGFPVSALRLAKVNRDDTGHHVVLLVMSDIGFLTLDVMTDEILPFELTNYELISAQKADNPNLWAKSL